MMKKDTQNQSVVNPTDTTTTKSVKVSDGVVSFSFEVPKDWITETRNDGEKQMNEEELREFLATSYRSDAKQFPDKQVSDYAHLTWNQLQKMTLSDMKRFMAERAKSVGRYPNASVGESNTLFGYIGPAPQIDFYISDIDTAKKELSNPNLRLDEETVGGVTAKVMKYAIEYDENGNPQPTLGASGGKECYVFLPELKKALIIKKQSLGSDEFEEAFDQLIQSLKFE